MTADLIARCPHNYIERTTATEVDGRCPLCLAQRIGELLEIDRQNAATLGAVIIERDALQAEVERHKEMIEIIGNAATADQAALQAKLAELEGMEGAVDAACDEADKLKAKLAEAERDAGRYRWLKERPGLAISWHTGKVAGYCIPEATSMDAAIDAAMGEEG